MVNTTWSSASSSCNNSLLKWVTYCLKVSPSFWWMLRRCPVGFLCRCPPMKCQTKLLLSCSKFAMVIGGILLNQTLATPFSVVGKALHITLSGVMCRCIRVLKDSMWSKRSFEPSYDSSWGRQNFARRGRFNTSVVNGESVLRISPSRFSMTFPFIALLSSSMLDEFSSEALVLLWSSLLFLCLSSFLWLVWALTIYLSSEFCCISSLTLAASAWICYAAWVESI